MTDIQPTYAQQPLFGLVNAQPHLEVKPFTTQLLKWVGNKQRYAHEIPEGGASGQSKSKIDLTSPNGR